MLSLVDGQREEIERATTARSHAVQNAKCDHLEADTQRSIVLGILRGLELPLEDWNAEGLVLAKFAERAVLVSFARDVLRSSLGSSCVPVGYMAAASILFAAMERARFIVAKDDGGFRFTPAMRKAVEERT